MPETVPDDYEQTTGHVITCTAAFTSICDCPPKGAPMSKPAEELRAAAEKLRELATAATPGPWRQHDTHLGQYGYAATVLSGEGNDTDLRAWLPSMSQEPWDETRNVWPDAAYIATMHPGVGLALAAWLDSSAQLHEPTMCRKHEGCAPLGCQWCADEDWPCADMRHALAVARAIGGLS